VFWTSVPIALGVAAAARVFIPESKSDRPRRPDLIGQALILTLLATVLFTIIELPRLGPKSPWILVGTADAILASAALVAVEHRRAEPLIDLRFFRSVPFSASILIAVLTYAAIGGFLFINTIYLQDVRGYAPLRAGLYTLPMALGTAIGAQLSGWLLRTRGALVSLVVAGVSVSGAALVVAAVIGTDSSPLLLAAYALLGLGFGGANTPVNNTAMAGMPRNQAGVAGAIASSSRQVGQSLGVAVFGAIASSGSSGALSATFSRASIPAWYLISGLGLAIIVAGIAASSKPAQRSAHRVARALDKP
jgi:predicted MFS family arabinose efflux permease